MVVPPAMADRVVLAMLHNIDDWAERVAEIERHAVPGNRVRVLELLIEMERCRVALRKLAGIPPG